MVLDNYKSVLRIGSGSKGVNKIKCPLNEFSFNDKDINEYNKLIRYCKENLHEAPATKKGAISTDIRYKYQSRFTIIKKTASIELLIVTDRIYRFLLRTYTSESEQAEVTGKQAYNQLKKTLREFDINLDDYAITDGKEVKESIKRPDIRILSNVPTGQIINHVYHLDFNSSYASRIVEKHPELKKAYEYIYSKRKENNGYFKHVLTNSIGYMQSEFCVINGNRYALSNLSKIAIDGTAEIVQDYLIKLMIRGYKPLLTNTDGIWYQDLYNQGEFKDENYGTELGQYKTDYANGDLIIKSAGAYQFRSADGKVKTVVRGYTKLDEIKSRDDWYFGEVLEDHSEVQKYTFNNETYELECVN